MDTRESDDETIEERCFLAALSCIEGHFLDLPSMGPLTLARVASIVNTTLEKTHGNAARRTTLAKNVSIWISLTRVFGSAVADLSNKSLGPLLSSADHDRRATSQESNTLVVNNYTSLKEDLQILIKLMHIARNLLVTAEPEIPQSLCAAVVFDHSLFQIILLCIKVASKGSEGEMLDDVSQANLIEINELFKKLLVVSLQQTHNWIAKHERNKMSFWLDVLFDYDIGSLSPPQSSSLLFPTTPDVPTLEGFYPNRARYQIRKWIEENFSVHPEACELLYKDMEKNASAAGFGSVDGAVIDGLAGQAQQKSPPEWQNAGTPVGKPGATATETSSVISEEIEVWYSRYRASCYVGATMTTIDNTKAQIENCKSQRLNRCYAQSQAATASTPGNIPPRASTSAESCTDACSEYADDYGEDDIEEDDGLLAGILTEIPNILDPKQIEALHMIVKSCVIDTNGTPSTHSTELQKTRCKMFLALECGKSLLREILVFIAVWEMEENSLIFKLTNQIIHSIHKTALIPYAWQSLRIPKDIMSPAQTVLLRMIHQILETKRDNYHHNIAENSNYTSSEEFTNDLTLIHFLFHIFRYEVVPECLALMHIQAQVRENKLDPLYFPVDLWDMDRAKDGLAVFLDLIILVADIPESRTRLIEWEAIFDLVALLNGLDAAVAKKPLVSVPSRARGSSNNNTSDQAYPDASGQSVHSIMQEPAFKFPWSGLKAQIFTIMAHLLQPPLGRNSPGNAAVQQQIVRNNGIVPLLNSCAYDDYNPFAKERVAVCLKWLLDGCEAANNFFRDLISLAPPMMTSPGGAQAGAGGAGDANGNTGTGSNNITSQAIPETTRIRVDGIEGEINVEVRKKSSKGKAPVRHREVEKGMKAMSLNSNGNTEMEENFM
ncbi:Copper transport protein 86 [Ceratocystis lukuohia]|uniref:Ataxin-10 homolog n=1 Tax=Ceratocystis lukuohia TaxID=2019550 RepID=A0ABR4MP18_9PEZI